MVGYSSHSLNMEIHRLALKLPMFPISMALPNQSGVQMVIRILDHSNVSGIWLLGIWIPSAIENKTFVSTILDFM
jgi:hypothetical protein